METIDQLKARQAKELAKLEAKHAFTAKLPGAPWHVNLSAATGAPSAHYEVEGLRGVLALIDTFDTVVPFAKMRDGFLMLRPGETFAKQELRDKMPDQWALALDVEHHAFSHCGAGTKAKVKFFVRVEGVGLVQICADITGPGYIGSFNSLTPQYRLTGEMGCGKSIDRSSLRPNPALNGAAQDYICWGTGSDEHAHHTYLIRSDYADMDITDKGDMSHALATLKNLSDEFDAKECSND